MAFFFFPEMTNFVFGFSLARLPTETAREFFPSHFP